MYDRLREQGANVVGFVASHKARGDDRFVNRRAEVFWEVREAMREGLVDLDPADEELASQLVAIRFDEDSRGRIQIERKTDMKKRGVSSPDHADALAMTFATEAWRPAPVVSDEEQARLDMEEALRRYERVQRARALWPEAPPGCEGGPVMSGVRDMTF